MKKIFFFMLFLLGTCCADPIKELDQFTEQALKKWNVPGLSVSIVKDGKVIFEKGYGITNADTQEKVNQNTIFQLASVTKPFTAAALGVLVDRKIFSWDDRVLNHMPNFSLQDPYPTYYTTARDLLAHRTGLPAFGGDLLGKLGYSHEEIIAKARLIKPASTFRDKAHYSNLGYLIAGELVASLAKSTWEKVVEETQIHPLGMKRTGFEANLNQKNVAYPHILENGKFKVVPWDRTGGFPPAGAITSTASDMGKWMTMLLNQGTYQGKKILEPETVFEMFESSMAGEVSFSEAAPISKYSGFNFGLGWDNYHYQGKMVVEKGGGLDGIRTVVTLVPEMNLGITILTNLNLTLLPEAVRAKFLELYVGKSDEDLQKTIWEQGVALQKLIQKPKFPENPLPPSRPLANLEGDFENELYGTFQVVLNGNELNVIVGPGKFKGKLTHYSGDTFILSWPVVNTGNDETVFTYGEDGKATVMTIDSLGKFNRSSQKRS